MQRIALHSWFGPGSHQRRKYRSPLAFPGHCASMSSRISDDLWLCIARALIHNNDIPALLRLRASCRHLLHLLSSDNLFQHAFLSLFDPPHPIPTSWYTALVLRCTRLSQSIPRPQLPSLTLLHLLTQLMNEYTQKNMSHLIPLTPFFTHTLTLAARLRSRSNPPDAVVLACWQVTLRIYAFLVSSHPSLIHYCNAELAHALRYEVYVDAAPTDNAAHAVLLLMWYHVFQDGGAPSVHLGDNAHVLVPDHVQQQGLLVVPWSLILIQHALPIPPSLPLRFPPSSSSSSSSSSSFSAFSLEGHWTGYCIFISSESSDEIQPHWYTFSPPLHPPSTTFIPADAIMPHTPPHHSLLSHHTGDAFNVLGGTSHLPVVRVLFNPNTHTITVEALKQYEHMPQWISYRWHYFPQTQWLIGYGWNTQHWGLRLGLWLWRPSLYSV